tara:strand:- start:765 stop:959 length:195 start_codon:yes stop_codon:yes gene_type:complete
MTKLILRNKVELKKWAKNVLVFTAPALAVFFYQLSIKVPWQASLALAALVFYGALADYFKKLNK